MREHFGPGWRMYYVQRGAVLTVMLGGGDKSTQSTDIAEQLPDDQAIAEYLTVVLEENDPAALADALGTIARARGMTEIAKASGLGRAALYKALRPNAQPRFDTVSRVCAALGVKLVAQVARA